MNCALPKMRLHEYLEGRLSPAENAELEKHLHACQDCSGYLADLRETLRLTGNLTEVEPPAWLTQKIMAKVAEEGSKRTGLLERLFGGFSFRLPLAAAAALVVAVTAAVLMKSMEPEVQKVMPPPAPEQSTALKEEVPAGDKPQGTQTRGEFAKGMAKNMREEDRQKPLPAAPRVPSPRQPSAGIQPQVQQPVSRETAQHSGSYETADESLDRLQKSPAHAPAPAGKELKAAAPPKDQAINQASPAAGAPARIMAQQPAGAASEPGSAAGKMDRVDTARTELQARPAAKEKKEESAGASSIRQVITERHENGRPRAAVTFRSISGESRRFFEERFDEQGRRHEVHKAYDSEGRISAEVRYEHGEVSSIREYHPDGSLKKGASARNWPWLNR